MEMGLSGMMGTEPKYLQAMEHVSRLSKAHNKPLMCVALGEEMTKQRLAQGFSLLVVTSDVHTVAYGTIGDINKAKETVASYKSSHE